MKTKKGKKIYDGFEEKELSNIWSRRRFEKRAIEIQSKKFRKGKSAVKIILRTGDKKEKCVGCKTSERDELLEKDYLWITQNQPYSYSFSLFLPKNFPIVPTRLVLAQWKQREGKNKVKVNNPLIALRFEKKKLRVTLQTTKEKEILFATKEEIRGRWTDFKFHINFTGSKNGFLKVWINKKRVVEYYGKTAYPKSYNHLWPPKFLFKMGLYRDRMKKPMTAYFDEYKKEKL